MKNMKIPSRPAPSAEEARHKYTKNSNQESGKRKPPPRPPPPDFSKLKSRSAWTLNKQTQNDWTPPGSPKPRTFGGSVSSSFSSSTSSLASSKQSFEYDISPFNINLWNTQTSPVTTPTIIRATKKSKSPETSRNYSPPMPSIPPPSPPKNVSPFGIAVYDFISSQIGDLSLQVNDVVMLLRQVNNEWLYGRIGDREGMFPANFVDIQVPLTEPDDKTVTALYEFRPQMPGDLALIPGQIVHVLYKISNDWLAGESDGQKGQFPANFVDRIPTTL